MLWHVSGRAAVVEGLQDTQIAEMMRHNVVSTAVVVLELKASGTHSSCEGVMEAGPAGQV
jgi:hypothetical protein